MHVTFGYATAPHSHHLSGPCTQAGLWLAANRSKTCSLDDTELMFVCMCATFCYKYSMVGSSFIDCKGSKPTGAA